MAVAALVLYGCWFVLAFGVRIAIQIRRTGASGFNGMGGRPGSLEWIAGMLFVVALAVGVAAPIAALAGGLDPVSALDAPWLQWPGVALAAAGVVATLGAQLSMGSSWRIGVDETERTELVTAGAFELVRNPIYSAMLLTAVGLTLMVPNVLALIGLVALVAALELQVRVVEEPYLSSVHGPAYAGYRERVGRFVPGIGR
jgi:protein-S-isoprenylcysteine O-methyltransferase Ste14